MKISTLSFNPLASSVPAAALVENVSDVVTESARYLQGSVVGTLGRTSGSSTEVAAAMGGVSRKGPRSARACAGPCVFVTTPERCDERHRDLPVWGPDSRRRGGSASVHPREEWCVGRASRTPTSAARHPQRPPRQVCGGPALCISSKWQGCCCRPPSPWREPPTRPHVPHCRTHRDRCHGDGLSSLDAAPSLSGWLPAPRVLHRGPHS